ncbi:zinc finger (Ran-binding) family protein [Euphorbia peplus]|nr:zinc finger (Ran-binding) family protein [Euphorbia peplus]
MHNLFRSPYQHLKNYHNAPTSLVLFSKFHTSPKTLSPNSKLDLVFHQVEALNSLNQTPRKALDSGEGYPESENTFKIQVSHPWPEWVDLMELLFKRGYFQDGQTPYRNGELGTKESNWVRTACLNFARDNSGFIRFFSRKDIHMITVCGCPSLDRKVVNSGKRLRAHVGIDEGNVCSSCNLRGDCERAYVKAREDEGGRTVDVMRFLLTYGLDSISDRSRSSPSQNKIAKESARRLLKEMVEFSTQEFDAGLPNGTLKSRPSENHSEVPMKQGDWICPKCNFLNFAKNIRCLRCDGLFEDRLRRLREDQEHLPLKKGDWICQKCNFLNFAKNTRCLQCKEKPPKRHLNPGEWECESCNYINFRRNMLCLKCDHRRPKALNSPNNMPPQHEQNSRMRSAHGENEIGNELSVGPDRTNERNSAKTWRFLEEDGKREGNLPNSRNKESSFLDFPIMGGKSSLSQDAEKREKWKLEMLEKSRTGTRTGRRDKESRNTETTLQPEYIETSDEDMAEWFGHKKKTG